MEQLINNMLANAQIPQIVPAVKKSESAPKDGFQKLLEQKQTDAPQSPRQEDRPEAVQKPQENPEKPQETDVPQEGQAVSPEGRELEDRMALAAMAMLQSPVVPVEQVLTPEVQAEAAADEAAPLTAEVLLAPETRNAAPEAERKALEIPLEADASQAEGQMAAEEIPQAVQAPEAPQETEERTVEVKVETGRAEARDADAPKTEEAPELRDAEAEAPVFEEVRAVPVKVGEAPRAQKAEEPVEKQIAPKLTEALQNGETRVELQLTPENLGRVTVEMTWNKDGGLTVQIHAENRGTQELLSKNATGLEQLLSRETQEQVRVEVPRQEESQRQDLYEQQQEHHQRRQQEQRRKQEGSSEDFLQQLRLGLIPLDGE